MLGGDGGVAVFGSFAAVVAASTTTGTGGRHRMNVLGFFRDLSIFRARNSSRGTVDCSSDQMISEPAKAVDCVTADGFSVVKSVELKPSLESLALSLCCVVW